MQVNVLLFGQLKEIVGASEQQVELPEDACVADLFDHYRRRFPRLEELRTSIAVAVNQEYAEGAAPLRAGDEVAFLPPVSGGATDKFASPVEVVELTQEPINVAALLQRVKAPSDGAVVAFDGIVRNHSSGRRTLYLDYDAYEPMALAKMGDIAAKLRARYDIDGIVLVHCLGRLEIGETSVFIAVSASHRAAAFEACRCAIDTLKRSVPIWKKEYFAGGEVWAEGELPGPPVDTVPVREES